MIGFKINFVQIRTFILLEVFVKILGKPITPRGLVIYHRKDNLFEVLYGEKFLIKSPLLDH